VLAASHTVALGLYDLAGEFGATTATIATACVHVPWLLGSPPGRRPLPWPHPAPAPASANEKGWLSKLPVLSIRDAVKS